MLTERVKDFLDIQLENLNDFDYKLDNDENHIYVIFTKVLDKKMEKELTFKLIDNVLFLHSTTYGWKPIEKASLNRYFWLELLA
jgi:hypothetical protein